MKTVHYNYKISNKFKNKDFNMYFENKKPCIFDIETTGLSGKKDHLILAALFFPEGDNVHGVQFFAENIFEEFVVVKSVLKCIEDENSDFLITYNGDSFDIPFFNTRAEKLSVGKTLSIYNFDLYRFIKRSTVLPSLIKSLSQKNVENFFGILSDRLDTIDGKESISLYFDYINSPVKDTYEKIITHNAEDVMQLYKIFSIITENSFKEMIIEKNIHKAMAIHGFPSLCGNFSIIPELGKSFLKIHGKQMNPANAVLFSCPGSPANAKFIKEKKTYNVLLPIIKYADSLFFDIGIIDNVDELFLQSAKNLDGFVNGSIILCENGQKKHREINFLSMLVLSHIKNLIF